MNISKNIFIGNRELKICNRFQNINLLESESGIIE